MVLVKINYASVSPIIKITYDETPVYIKTSVNNVYAKVVYGTSIKWGDIEGTLSDQTDLQNALDDKVPYTGATANVDLGEYELKAGQLTLDVSPTGTASVGTTRWNNTIGSSETTLKGGSVVLKNGVDLVARIVNKVTPNTTLTKAAYQAVRISGAQGQRLAVAFAQANNDNNSADTIGLVTETIPTNQEGFIMTVGSLEGINTTGSLQGETWSDGDVLYLSPTVAGAITNVKPVAPQHLVVIGYVEYAHQNNGKIYVKVMNGWELGELHDVNTNGATNGQVLTYNGSIWVPSTNGVGTVTSVDMTVPTGLTVSGNPITSSGTLALGLASGYSIPTDANQTNWTAAYNDKINSAAVTGTTTKTLTLNQQDGGTITASWTDDNSGTVTSVGLSSATSGVTIGSSPVTTSGTITLAIATASGSGQGLLSSTDWTTFNNKQNAITLTTTGTSGAATLVGATLNIPQYADQFVGTVTSVAALTLGTTGTDLSSSVANSTTTPVITLNVPTASATNRGALSSADWSTFNNKQNTLTLTTTGTSGAATLVGATLNIPQYQAVLTNPVTGTGTTNYVPKWTSGSAIGNSQIFDNGTNVGIGTASPSATLQVKVNTNKELQIYSPLSSVISDVSTLGVGIKLSRPSDGLFNYSIFSYISSSNLRNLAITTRNDFVIATGNDPENATEKIRLTSGGNLLVGTTTDGGQRLQVNGTSYFSGSVGIGVSPSYKLEVYDSSVDGVALFNSGNANGGHIRLAASGTVKSYIGSAAGFITSGGVDDLGLRAVGSIRFATNGAGTDMILDSSGNLGLGVVPSAWRNIFNAFQIGYTGTLYSLTVSNATEQVNLASNYYQNSAGAELRVQAGFATRYQQGSGEHRWSTAASSTAGSAITFTQAMTLNASGNLGIGTASPGNKFVVSNAGAEGFEVVPASNTNVSTLLFYNRSSSIYNTADLRASDYIFKIGTTERMRLDSSGNLGVGMTPSYRLDITSPSGTWEAARLTAGGNHPVLMRFVGGGGGSVDFGSDSAASVGIIRTGGNERVRITAAGNLLVGTTTDGGYKLDVNGTIRGTSSITGAQFYASNTNGLSLIDNAVGGFLSYGYNSGRTNAAGHYFYNGITTELMRITSGGNLLVGTTTDGGQRLQVSGSARIGSTTASAMYWDDTNNRLGIRTSSPNALLEIFNTTQAGSNEYLRLFGGANNGSLSLSFYPATNQSYGFIGSNTIYSTGGISRINTSIGGTGIALNKNTLDFFTGSDAGNPTLKMTLDASGNLGIGTNAPTSKLTIYDGLLGISNSSAGGEVFTIGVGATTSQFAFKSGGSDAFVYYTVGSGQTRGAFAVRNNHSDPNPAYTFLTDLNTGIGNAAGTADTLNFITNGIERARYTSSGNLLVGTTTDGGQRLQVSGTASVSSSITAASFIPSSSTVPTNGMYLPSANTLGFATNSAERIRITSTGLVGIGSDAPYSNLQIQGASDTRLVVQVVGTEVAGDRAGLYFKSAIQYTDSYLKAAVIFQNNGTGFGRGDLILAVNNGAGGTNVSPSDAKLTIAANGTATFSSSVTAASYTVNDAGNIAVGTTTGTKIGTATSQKIGFWNATPIVQPTTAVASAAFVANTGTAVNDASTFDGYTMAQVVKALRNAGLLA